MGNLIRLSALAMVLWMGGNLFGAAAQVTKAHADRTAAAICEATGDCNR